MDLRLFFTKRKILALILICLLISICYIIARRTSIINEPVPLSSTNIEAMFYVENSESGSVTCVGDGLINSTEETSGQDAVGSKIVTAPDQSAYLGNSQTISWSSIRNVDGEYRVYGKAVESTKVPSNSISVRDFGAIGDGVTDDTTALTNAFNNGSGKTVYFPSGTYVISSAVRVRSDTHVYGDGSTSIIIAKEGTKRGATMLKLDKNPNVVFDNICISGNSSVNYENMDSQDGIHLLDIWNSENITIKNCYFIDNIYAAIRDINTSNITVENCIFQNVDCGFGTLGSNDVHDIIVRNCIFDGHRSSEPVTLFANASHYNVLIENNRMSNKLLGCGILVAGKKPNNNIRIINNNIDSCATGIKVVNSTNVQVLNNSVSNSTSGGGIRIYNCTDTILDNNSCYNIQQDGLDVKDCTNLTISNLVTTNCGQVNGNFFNIRFRGDQNSNISFTDSSIEYNNTNSKIGLCFSCNTDISMNNIDYDNATIWLTKDSSNISLIAPSSVVVKNQGQANEITRY
ncbi:MAG: right-handed parallel beta-helix repeat-containing protein [Pseudobutyrivibrio sp.]|nr:right-handed parallel beta-helix repeat-containing protein [Pseudobutyrivibrio sp.]